MNSLNENTDKPEWYLKKTWSTLVNNKECPNAHQHLQYILIRSVLTKYPQTIRQTANRIKKAFPNCYRFELKYALYHYRYYGSSAYGFCSDELFPVIKDRAAKIFEELYG